jgi:hypothetical protein
LYYTSGKIEQSRLLNGKGVKSSGYLAGKSPNSRSKLSYLLNSLFAFYLLLLKSSQIPIL